MIMSNYPLHFKDPYSFQTSWGRSFLDTMSHPISISKFFFICRKNCLHPFLLTLKYNITFLVKMATKRPFEESQPSQISPEMSRLSPGSSDSFSDLSAASGLAQCPRKLSRRERANFNERRRMHGINAGYDLLKREIPSIANEKVAKVTCHRIFYLMFILRLLF